MDEQYAVWYQYATVVVHEIESDVNMVQLLWHMSERMSCKESAIFFANLAYTPVYSRVINLGSDTFGNPIFQKGLQN